MTDLYERADGGAAFQSALSQHSYVLAGDDQRGFVVVDDDGQVLILSRYTGKAPIPTRDHDIYPE